MKIAVDAMGGDFAPEEIVKGSIQAAREYQIDLIFTGPRERIEKEISRYDVSGLNIEIVHTDEYLIEGEAPAYALRIKRHASVILAARLVKESRAQAVVSMGPTGGIIASALMVLGTIEGISRPVVGGVFCGFAPQTIVMDIGGNMDAQPDQYLDFAIIGSVYARKVMQIRNPSIALLNVGVEEGKGNAAAKEAYSLLKQSGLNFIGNVEGNDISSGKANVVICDGFTGNVVVKYCEGLSRTIAGWLVKELAGNLPEARVKEITSALLARTVRADTTGGGPLWAVNGLFFKGHGRSQAYEVAQTLKSAKEYASLDIISAIRSEVQEVRSKLKGQNSGTAK